MQEQAEQNERLLPSGYSHCRQWTHAREEAAFLFKVPCSSDVPRPSYSSGHNSRKCGVSDPVKFKQKRTG